MKKVVLSCRKCNSRILVLEKEDKKVISAHCVCCGKDVSQSDLDLFNELTGNQ